MKTNYADAVRPGVLSRQPDRGLYKAVGKRHFSHYRTDRSGKNNGFDGTTYALYGNMSGEIREKQCAQRLCGG